MESLRRRPGTVFDHGQCGCLSVVTTVTSDSGGGMATELGLSAEGGARPGEELKGGVEVAISKSLMAAQQRKDFLATINARPRPLRRRLAARAGTSSGAGSSPFAGCWTWPAPSPRATSPTTRWRSEESADEIWARWPWASRTWSRTCARSWTTSRRPPCRSPRPRARSPPTRSSSTQGAQSQAQAAEETSTSMEEMAASIQTVAGNAQSLATYVEETLVLHHRDGRVHRGGGQVQLHPRRHGDRGLAPPSRR